MNNILKSFLWRFMELNANILLKISYGYTHSPHVDYWVETNIHKAANAPL